MNQGTAPTDPHGDATAASATRGDDSGGDRRPHAVIVGAGLSGLTAARELVRSDWSVTVVDKGRSVGGRLATRRIGDARLDHGAQFFTVRSPAFRSQVDDWLERDVVAKWSNGFSHDDGHPRYVGTAGMTGLAKDLVAQLPADRARVECSTMVFTIRPTPGDEPIRTWDVAIDDGTVRTGDAVIVTSPLPQSLALLVDSGISLEGSPVLTDYDRTLCLLATLDRPPAIPAPGGVQEVTDGPVPFTFIGDNVAKGVSAVPAVTFHAAPEWSEAHWDDDADEVLDALVAAARPWLGDATIVERQLKKWRLATPRNIWPDPCYVTPAPDDAPGRGPVVLAGDAFAGPRVEGAFNSGLAAAHALTG